MKILIIQTAFIGDVVLATPVVGVLKTKYPDADIDVLVRKGNESLLLNNPSIRNILTWDKRKNKTLQLFNVVKAIRNERYDILINLQRFFSTGLMTALSGAKKTVGFDKNPFSRFFTSRISHQIDSGFSMHETERNLQLAEEVGATGSRLPELFPSADDYTLVHPYKTGNYFCIAPTSVWFTKQVPAVKWLELLHLIVKKFPDSDIYLLGGSGDFTTCEKIRTGFSSSRIKNLAGVLTFLQTAALMKDAQMNYVNDSAPLHFASAMNAAVTVFYCSTLPAFGFGPLSKTRNIIEVSGLPCRPCGWHGHKACPQRHFKCAMELDMHQAIQ